MLYTYVLYFGIMMLCVLFTSLIPNNCFNNKKKIPLYFLYTLIPIAIYTLFWGLRYNVGADYFNYIDLYNNYSYYSDVYEKGYIFLCYIINELGASFIGLFLVTSFLNIFLLYIVLRKESSKFAALSIYFYFTTSFCFFAQNGLRQMLAINILILTIYAINNRKKVNNIIILFLGGFCAFLFHKSSIFPFTVLLFLLLMPRLIINKKIIVSLYVFLFISSAALNFDLSFLVDLSEILGYSRNLERINNEIVISSTMESSFSVGNLLKQCLVILIFIYQDIFIKKKSPQYFCYNFVLIGSFLLLLIKGMLANRMFIYFNYMTFLVMAYLCYELIRRFKEKKQLKSLLIYRFIIISYFILYWYYISSNNNLCVPYTMVDF